MGQVGMFPDSKRITIPAAKNPMDKATVVSIYPRAIREIKHTIQPGMFEIAAGSYEKPAILVVGSSSWWRFVNEDDHLLEIPTGATVVADSIVVDFCNGMLGCDMADSMPGLFYIPGAHDAKAIKEAHKSMLDRAKVKQDNWYKNLIQMADVLWARSNGNPLTISADMRLAAEHLNLQKDWMKDRGSIEMKRCLACGNINNVETIVCPNCKVILDSDRFAKLGMKFAS